MQPINLFYCYAHQDEILRNELDTHLTPLKKSGLIQSWHDLDISPGEEWEKEIGVHLNTAQVILLLVSPDFIASNYCYGKEMGRAIERHNANNAVVVPIIIRPVVWEDAPFSRLQMLPSEAKAVTSWANRDEAFEDVVKGIRTLIRKLIKKLPERTIEFSIQQGDITEFSADVLGLKYAQDFYETDGFVAKKLSLVGIPYTYLCPKVGDYYYVDTNKCINATHALFVGVPDLFSLVYQDIRELSFKVLDILTSEDPSIRHIIMTMHGANCGLDETESLLAQFAGYLEAIQRGRVPKSLERITIVEIDNNRLTRIREILEQNLKYTEQISKIEGRWGYQISVPPQNPGPFPDTTSSIFDAIKNAGQKTEIKPGILVIMSIENEMEDVFYYGIQKPTHDVGFLCEHVGNEAFRDAIEQVKKKIDTAVAVVVEMSETNPVAYFGAGYAWGKGIPTIILLKQGKELYLEAKNWKCIKYTNIKNLEENLRKELNTILSS
jgi:TIR domain